MMKKLILILCILQGVLLSLRAQGEQQNIVILITMYGLRSYRMERSVWSMLRMENL